MAQFEFVVWLAKWLLEQHKFQFQWDDGNSAKSEQKHKVSQQSAEQVFHNRELLVPLGIQVSPEVNEPRFGVLGADFLGTRLSISFTIRGGLIRVISARPMSRVERINYEKVR